MKEINQCTFCGGDHFYGLFEQRDKNFDFYEKFTLEQCENCKVIFTSPQLTQKELEKYYPKGYYAFDKIKTKEESRKVRLRLFLYDLYYNNSLGNNILKILCSPFKFLIRGTQIIPGQKLLDIGCGSGQFLYEMKQFYMDVQGIEPGKIFKSDFNIKPDLIKAKYKKESFDLITMNHVLQHVNNPKEMVKEIYRILKQNGLFIVSASNTRSLAYEIFKKDWFQLDVPRHLFNLSDKQLIKFLEERGFKVIKNRHNSRPNQFVLSWFFKRDSKHREGILNRLLEVIFLPLTWIVNIFKIGDQVEIWCVKK